MREALKLGVILGLICVIAGLLLSGVNNFTKEKILEQEHLEEESALKVILPEAENFEKIEDPNGLTYYRVFDKTKKFFAVAFKASCKGYVSEIKVLVGMFLDGRISAIKVLSQNETPGLGSRIAEANFTEQFKGKRDLLEVNAISGATISSKAVIKAVKEAQEEILKRIKNER